MKTVKTLVALTGLLSWRTCALTALCAVAYCQAASGQVAPVTILEIDVERAVVYTYDVSDVSKFGTDPNLTTPSPARPFLTRVVVGDIVAVNGKPAKGLYVARAIDILAGPNPAPGRAIADITRGIIEDDTFEILQADGTPVGTLMLRGLGSGPAVPGAPLASTQSNFAITGGTGAFLGVRGQAGIVRVTRRFASVTEDPANRRTLGGAPRTFVMHIIPMSRPEIVAVTHTNDFSLVTPANSARSGEFLTLWATGLGPTRPRVDPGQPFPATPLQVVNSPVEVTVNGVPAEVLYAGGYPGTVAGYQVNIRLPAELTPGLASLQMKVAWIAGPEVKIAVR